MPNKPATVQRPWLAKKEPRHEAATERDKRYHSVRWRKLRYIQLANEPLCQECLKTDTLTPATVCDHIIPARSDKGDFWKGPFQSLCTKCHNHKSAKEAHA